MTESALLIENLHKTYAAPRGRGPAVALRGINLRVPRGQILGLLGPNGAGKSTTINILAGLVRKTTGRVTVWDRDLDRDPRNCRAAIGVVPQELNLDPFFTPSELLELQAGLYGVPPARRQTMALLTAVGLVDRARAPARSLSGGMRRRLMVAKAMVHAPPILVLDEPTAGVDVALRDALWAHVRTLHAAGTTIILTTHYLEEAEALCQRIAIIHQGQIVADAPTAALVARMDSKELLIRLTQPLLVLPLVLQQLSVQQDAPDLLRWRYAPSRSHPETLLAALAAARLAVADLSVREARLEDVFRHLTDGEKP